MSPIWKVEVPECSYDEYDAVVVRAASSEAALTIASYKFSKHQGEATVTLVEPEGDDEEILASFNAG